MVMNPRLEKSLWAVWLGIVLSLFLSAAGWAQSRSQPTPQASASSLRPPKDQTEAHARRLYQEYKKLSQEIEKSQKAIQTAENRARDEQRGFNETAGTTQFGRLAGHDSAEAIRIQREIADRERNRIAQFEAKQARIEAAWNKNGFAERYSPLNYTNQTEYNPMTKTTQDKVEKAIWFNQKFRGEGAPAKGAASKQSQRSVKATPPPAQVSSSSQAPHETGSQGGHSHVAKTPSHDQTGQEPANRSASPRQKPKRPPANTASQKSKPPSGKSASSSTSSSQGKHSISLTPAE
jgi:hypothetical protein